MSPRAFIQQLAWFATGLLLLFIACSVHYMILSRRDNMTRQLAIFASARPEFLVLGDSHPAMNVDMRTLGPRYATLAYPQENWREIFLKARYALAAKREIRGVVIPVDLHMFAAYRAEDSGMTNSMRFTRAYADLEPLYRSPLFPLRYLKSLIVYYVPLCLGPNWSNYRGLVLDDIQDAFADHAPRKRIEIDNFGTIYYSDGKTFADLPRVTREAAAHTRAGELFRPPNDSESLVRAFDAFLGLCAERHIAVVGVRYPLTSEVQRAATAYDIRPAEEVYRKRGARMAAILDYTHLMDSAPRSFRDEDHLTRAGARAFTRVLGRDLDHVWGRLAMPGEARVAGNASAGRVAGD